MKDNRFRIAVVFSKFATIINFLALRSAFYCRRIVNLSILFACFHQQIHAYAFGGIMDLELDCTYYAQIHSIISKRKRHQRMHIREIQRQILYGTTLNLCRTSLL